MRSLREPLRYKTKKGESNYPVMQHGETTHCPLCLGIGHCVLCVSGIRELSLPGKSSDWTVTRALQQAACGVSVARISQAFLKNEGRVTDLIQVHILKSSSSLSVLRANSCTLV